LKLSWSMQRRVDRWKIKYDKLIKLVIKIKKKIKKINKKGVNKMNKNKKLLQSDKTILFEEYSNEYIGLTIEKDTISLINSPPLTLPVSKHHKKCECDICIEMLIGNLAYQFDKENDEE